MQAASFPCTYFHSQSGRLFLSMEFIPIIVHTHDRCFLINHLIDLRCLFTRQINATMGSAVNIDFSSKARSPGSIMQSDSTVKRHPVVYMRLITRLSAGIRTSPKNSVFLLICQEINSRWSKPVFCHSSGHKRGVQHHFSFLIIIQMLFRQIDFYVSIPQTMVICIQLFLTVLRLSRYLLLVFNILFGNQNAQKD